MNYLDSFIITTFNACIKVANELHDDVQTVQKLKEEVLDLDTLKRHKTVIKQAWDLTLGASKEAWPLRKQIKGYNKKVHRTLTAYQRLYREQKRQEEKDKFKIGFIKLVSDDYPFLRALLTLEKLHSIFLSGPHI